MLHDATTADEVPDPLGRHGPSPLDGPNVTLGAGSAIEWWVVTEPRA